MRGFMKYACVLALPLLVAGKSVSDLMDKMKAYQSGTFTDAKLLGMQQVLKPLSDKQLLDLAAYINKM